MSEKYTIFMTLCLLICRSWCPDRTLSQARKYVEESIGRKYAEGVILDLQKTWEESDIRTPMICFLSMGSDPTNNIESLAKRLKLGKVISVVSTISKTPLICHCSCKWGKLLPKMFIFLMHKSLCFCKTSMNVSKDPFASFISVFLYVTVFSLIYTFFALTTILYLR